MIHIINRHCNFSAISANKIRPEWFSREKCFENWFQSLQHYQDVDYQVIFDGDPSAHFIGKRLWFAPNKITTIDARSGSKSFRLAIDYALKETKADFFYFLEDDYIHTVNWIKVLKEGLSIVKDTGYVSLYDHPDKYCTGYKGLQSEMLVTKSCHWRTTPSTTDTFAISRKLLEKEYDTFMAFSSDDLNHSRDHKRCVALWNKGVPLITPIPGYSTHCETNNLSPIINWEGYL